MARRTKQEAEATKDNILNAALDIIYEKGYARATFVDIANKIDLTKGAVYWHFKNKPDLFLALGRCMEEKIEQALADLFRGTRTLSGLKRMLYEMIQLIANDEQLRKYYTIVFYRMEWTDELLQIKRFFELQDQMMLDWISELLGNSQKHAEIPHGKDILVLSRALLELVGGLLSFCLSGSVDSTDMKSQIVQTGLNTFFDGMQTNTITASEETLL